MITQEDKLILTLKYGLSEYVVEDKDRDRDVYVILTHTIPDEFFIEYGYGLPLVEYTAIVTGAIPMFYANLMTWSNSQVEEAS